MAERRKYTGDESPMVLVPADCPSHSTTPEGLHKGLGNRQMQMIAIGSAIGTGLFLGAGGALATAGPSLFLVYAVCGFFGYLILRALGELIVYRPTSGSFVSYAREFYGEGMAYVVGWLYWLNWAMTAVADATALAIYIGWFSRYNSALAEVPQWVSALAVVVVVLVMNFLSVKVFGHLEFWFSIIKVGALVLFLIVGTALVIFGTPTGDATGPALIAGNGGLFPNGVLPAFIMLQGVVFAYAGIELIGTASGEAKEPEKVIPRAINSVIVRIALFYVGSVVLLCMLLPWTRYSADESPFVTFFSSIGVPGIDVVMQMVVITAAFSSLNAGMYSTGRILHSMARAGSAPAFCGRLTSRGVPFGGIALTSLVALVGVVINYLVPADAFAIVVNLAALGTIASWVAITLSHIRFVQLARRNEVERPSYRAPFTPFADYLTLVFLAVVIVLMWFDPVGRATLICSMFVFPILGLGWLRIRDRINTLSQAQASEPDLF